MAQDQRTERRSGSRSKPGEITRVKKTGAFLEKKAVHVVEKGPKLGRGPGYLSAKGSGYASGKVHGYTAVNQARLRQAVRELKELKLRELRWFGAEALNEAVDKATAEARAAGMTVNVHFTCEITVEPSGSVRMAADPIELQPAGAKPAAGTEPASTAAPASLALRTAIDQALRRGQKWAAEILTGAEMKSADEFARMIGTSRETVNQKRNRHEALGLEGPKRGVRYPDWQLTADGGLLPGLPELFAEIGDHPWEVYRFLVSPHLELGGATGVEAMKQGRVAEAVALAANIGRGAFS